MSSTDYAERKMEENAYRFAVATANSPDELYKNLSGMGPSMLVKERKVIKKDVSLSKFYRTEN